MTTIGTKITNAKGVVQTKGTTGTSIQADTQNSGFMPYAIGSVTRLTTETTMSLATHPGGIYSLSAAAAFEVKMPAAATVAGALYTFKAYNAKAFTLTGSAETPGTGESTVFTHVSSSAETGSRLTFAAAANNSVTLFCDGTSFIILGSRGVTTLSGA